MDYFTDVLATFLDLGTFQSCCCRVAAYRVAVYLMIQDGAEHGSRVASSEKTLQFFVCFICYFVVLHVGCC